MFLEEHDLQTLTKIDDLEAKYQEIEVFTRALFDDMNDAERNRLETIKHRFEELSLLCFKTQTIF